MPAAIPLAAAAVGAVGSGMAASKAAKGQAAAAAAANSPWSAAQPYISGEFGTTQDALHGALNMGTYGGPRVAGLNPYQTTGATNAGGYALGAGTDTAGALYGAGKNLIGAGQNFGTNAQTLFDMSGGDPTESIISSASRYANNPYVDGLIDASGRDITRNMNENQLPTLALGAAGSGNTNSTRTGVAEGIIQRGNADRLADMSNTIRSSFFNNGLTMAKDQYNTDFSNRLNANQQLGSAVGMGAGTLLNGQQANANNFDQTQAAGGVFQGNEQQNIDASMKKFAEDQNIPLDLLGKYMSVINGKFGGAPIATNGTSVGGSALQGALGGGLAGLGLYEKLGGYNNSTPAPVTVDTNGVGMGGWGSGTAIDQGLGRYNVPGYGGGGV